MVINAPLSRKLWIANIAAKQSYGIGASYVDAWWNLWQEWDWTGWIKPQIDYAVSNGVGCNGIRLLGSLEGVFASKYSQDTYNTQWQQLVDYCAGFSPPVYVYFCGGWFPQVSPANGVYNTGLGASMTNQQIADGINSVLSSLSARTNIIGIDAIQEANAWYVISGLSLENTAARCTDIYSKIKAGGTALPVTFSNYDIWTADAAKEWAALIAAGMDFLDFHFYAFTGYDASNPIALSDLNYWRSTYPTLDILCGEFGSPESESYDVVAAFHRSVLTAFNSGDLKVRGAGIWASGQGNTTTSDDWGMNSSTFVPRLSRQRAMRAFTGGSIARRN